MSGSGSDGATKVRSDGGKKSECRIHNAERAAGIEGSNQEWAGRFSWWYCYHAGGKSNQEAGACWKLADLVKKLAVLSRKP